jgi:hypothetical protein
MFEDESARALSVGQPLPCISGREPLPPAGTGSRSPSDKFSAKNESNHAAQASMLEECRGVKTSFWERGPSPAFPHEDALPNDAQANGGRGMAAVEATSTGLRPSDTRR